MNVTPPKKWAKITGTVTGVACDGTSAALEDAIVQVTGTQFAVTLLTDENGAYAWWLDSKASQLTLIAAKDGYVPQTESAKLKAGKTTTVNFALQAQGC
jgi:hypothetical protein